MSIVFRLTGALLGLYIVRCLVRGEVYARSGPWARTFRRDAEAFEYWSTLVVYAALTLALIFWF